MTDDITTYNELAPINNFDFVEPLEYFPVPSNTDIQNEYIMRYFVKSVNGNNIIEVSAENYGELSNILYIMVSFEWRIGGAQYNIYTNNVMQQLGAYEYNLAQIQEYTETMSGLNNKLANPLQFYTSQ